MPEKVMNGTNYIVFSSISAIELRRLSNSVETDFIMVLKSRAKSCNSPPDYGANVYRRLCGVLKNMHSHVPYFVVLNS